MLILFDSVHKKSISRTINKIESRLFLFFFFDFYDFNLKESLNDTFQRFVLVFLLIKLRELKI